MNAVINPPEFLDGCIDHGPYRIFIWDIYLNSNSTEVLIFGELFAFFDECGGIVQISQDNAFYAGFREGQDCLFAYSGGSLFDDE